MNTPAHPENGTWNRVHSRFGPKVGILALVWMLTLSACATNLQSKVSGNLNQLSKQQTVAILPVEILEESQKEMAAMFRQSLYANLKQSHFNLMERYVVDGLLQKHNLTEPSKFPKVNPMTFGEILGADAVVLTRVNKVERSYMVVHSSIELSVSVEMVDTRTGEVLWRAEQTESDFQGIGKIPTGIIAAILAPIQFVTNKLNLQGLTSKMTSKLTAILKDPEEAEEEKTFEEPEIVSAAARDLKEMEEMQKLKSEWIRSAEGETNFAAEKIDSVVEALEKHSPPALPEETDAEEVFTIQKNHGNRSIAAGAPTIQHIKLAGKTVPVKVGISTTVTADREPKVLPEIQEASSPPASAPKAEAKPEGTLKQKETEKPKEET
ncbi:MAG: GNA1162 family protein, partial [Nitrospinaceae bacterium]